MRDGLELVSRLLWAVALAGAGLGAVNFAVSYLHVLNSLTESMSAPQLAALSTESMVLAVVPYVLARAWDEAILRRWPSASERGDVPRP